MRNRSWRSGAQSQSIKRNNNKLQTEEQIKQLKELRKERRDKAQERREERSNTERGQRFR